MKFDIIIGNPPYQLADGGGTGDSARPIYNLFIEQAIKLKPRFLTFIVPSRWMKGGKGLDQFRSDMLNDRRIKFLYDYENAKEVFPSINLDGGVCYFLWDMNHNSELDYYYYSLEKELIHSKRYLKTEFSDTAIRDVRQQSIIEKSNSLSKYNFSSIVSSRNPYGFGADFFNRPGNYGYEEIPNKKAINSIKIYGVKGIKGGAKRVIGYIPMESVQKNINDINDYKLFFSKAYMTTATVPPEIILGDPLSICTETFLQIGPFKTKEERDNCLEYIKTKFFRALLFFSRHSLNISKDSFSLIPLMNLKKKWTDKELYEHFNLNEKEINYIENIIEEMD